MARMRRNLSPAATLADLVVDLRQDDRLGPQIVHTAFLPAQEARYGDLDPPLPAPIAAALARGGVARLWSHQAAAVTAVRRREDVLVTTPTASGKSLVFQLPALAEAAAGGPGRGLFLFPLKALGQDQRGKFLRLAADAGLDGELAGCEIYDGDTPSARRAAIRRQLPRVLISNPDMLHAGILGHWTLWGPLLADLSWIVLDELHTYRGIFGSHFHHVLQRLLRLSRSVGGDPVLIASSATAANAGQFARDLAGREFRWITESGAPREGRHLLLVRPEASPYTAALRLFVCCLAAGLKTIVFTKARRITELLYSWLRRQEPELASRVASYRAGFLPEERRRVEQSLWSGALDGVISTSALEMGIDVGGLDACILVGYPGSMMATWQRSGRVGRNGRESITAMVAMPDALDQYFLDHPEQFLERPCERLVVDPGNRPVARAHLVCAAAELPLEPRADAAYLKIHRASLDGLLRQGHLLQAAAEAPEAAAGSGSVGEEVATSVAAEGGGAAAAAGGGEIYCLRRNPQRLVGLRGSGNTFAILDGRGRTIGTVDGVRALHECHPGAVYLHAGRQYLVEALEREERRVRSAAADLDYFTTPITEKQTEILEVLERQEGGGLAACLGRLKVTEWVVGFERKRVHGQETIDQTPLDLPPVSFETVGLWWQAPRHFEETLRRAGEHFLGALHASEHAAISLFPLLALCDRGDIGGISYPFHPQVGCGAVFVYDGHSGGVGITARGYEDLAGLLERVHQLIAGCPCESGCPSCIQSPKCGNGNRPLDKPGALRILRLLLGRESAAVPAVPPTPVAGWGEEAAPEEALEPAAGGRPARPVEAPVLADGLTAPHGLEESPGLEMACGPAAGHGLDAAHAFEAESGHVAVGPGFEETEESVAAALVPPGQSEESGGWRRARMPEMRGEEALEALPNGLLAEQARRHRERPLTVLFDVETLRSAAEVGGFGNCHRMGLAIAVACFLEEGRFECYGEKQVHELIAALRQATLVVGFNIKRFDYGVLAGYTGEDYCRTLPTFDLLEDLHRRLGFRVGLGRLAADTLGAGKSADGLQSLEWVRQGRLDLVEDYCRHDVEILRDLYLFGRREGCLIHYDSRRDLRLRVGVDW
jgi:DEAD/DEAH box helicase domain-containing protein